MSERTPEQRFGKAVRQLLELQGTSQEAFGEAVARRQRRPEGAYAQGSVASWLEGRFAITPALAFAIEDELRCDPGSLSSILGFVPASTVRIVVTVIQAIESDLNLSNEGRATLLAAYRAAVKASR